MIFERLVNFRQQVYELIGLSQDSLFDLMDAVLTSAHLSSFVQVSLNPLFRREWSSVYSGLKRSRLSQAKVMKQVVGEIPSDSPVFLAGDTTVWPRPDARTLKERTSERLSAAKGDGFNWGRVTAPLLGSPRLKGVGPCHCAMSE